MAPPLSTPDDNAAFLACCINKTRTLQDVYESLGLFSQTNCSRKDPDFYVNGANELYKRIKQIAKDFAAHYRGDLEGLQDELAKDTAFSEELLALGTDFGQTVWGRSEYQRQLSSTHDLPLEELQWSDANDRNNIMFYIRCWITRLAVKDISATPRKAKGKGPARTSDAPEDDQDSDNSGDSHIPYRAPEPPRMLPPPVSRAEIPQRLNKFYQTAMASKETDDYRGGSIISVESASNTPSRRTNTPPSKRKARSFNEHTPIGKLRKTDKGSRAGHVPFREQRGDIYSVPRSPTAPLDLARLTGSLGLQRLRESTHDTDTTWMPRCGTAETETVVDAFDVPEAEIDSLLQATIDHQEYMDIVDQDEEQCFAGPSGTCRNPLRRDSVIPTDSQNSTRRAASEPTENRVTSNHREGRGVLTEVFLPSRPLNTATNDGVHEKAYRRELFKLLVPYLNGINQFSAETFDTDAEDRMNLLFHQLQINDTETLQAKLGNDFTRLHVALESWMSMRHRLSEFRVATGYFGQPGRQWEEHLQRMPNVPCAHATLAFVDLQESTISAGESIFVTESFNADLERMFDLLTMMKGCNGADAFKGVRLYNTALMEWFKPDG